MASVTSAPGGAGFSPVPAEPAGQSTAAQATAAITEALAGAPRIERIGGVRIIRGGPGWRGIALRLAPGRDGEERFELALTAGDGRSLTIAEADHEDAVALWRDLGRTSGLPLLIETGDGCISNPYPQIGRLALGPVRIRRRHALLAGRRPRFLARRKPGRLAERPVIVQGVALFE